MKIMPHRLIVWICGIFLVAGCRSGKEGPVSIIDREAVIEPDYSGVTIPPNIAPMNFMIREEGRSFRITASSGNQKISEDIRSADGIIRFPERSWKKLLVNSKGSSITFDVTCRNGTGMKKFKPFRMMVADEPVDPWLVYRMIPPGYYSWSRMRIVQRCLENFRESSIIENQVLNMNCVNCHTFNQRDPGKFLLHIRGSNGGTYIIDKGKITRKDPKIDAMPGSATYPSWHPGGRYVAFSSNQVRQSFYGNPSKVIEVFDLISSIIIFDNEKNEIRMVRDQDTTKYLSTFPSWSPDGKYLYYCRAIDNGIGANPELDKIRSMRYDIVRTAFDAETGLTGNTEMVFRASSMGKSASFPRISPDGKYLVLTLDDYGTFPIWHREADLYLLDLQSRNCTKMDLNSDENESYHTWSSNSRWLVFSSKRMDGRSGRSFIAWIDTNGHAGKPFVVPQKDPRRYGSMLESFNIPEFVTGRISVGPRDFIAASKQQSVKSVPADKADSIMRPDLKKLNVKPNPGETPLHE